MKPLKRVMRRQRLARTSMNQVERPKKEEIKEKEKEKEIVPAKKRKMS